MKQVRSKKARLLGWIAAAASAASCGKSRARQRKNGLDYRISTRKIGVRMSERVREVFRFRWVRKSKSA